jgi:hypothetical protein
MGIPEAKELLKFLGVSYCIKSAEIDLSHLHCKHLNYQGLGQIRSLVPVNA